ncbi:IS30 family transposase [Schaalia cardiffensis]|uniref:IS30 family transposase n=1 Tax=Schaalia cardiffensis TaxID=181487 RepID=UPI003C703FAC
MRQRHTPRRPATDSRQTRPRFKDPAAEICERPASVEDRAIPGHWEGDLNIGAKGQSAVGTLVERSTRYTVLLYPPNRHTAQQVQDAIINKLTGLPHSLRLSPTWDQKSELAQHRKITSELGLNVYFVIRTPPGNAAQTKTRTATYASTCPKTPT